MCILHLEICDSTESKIDVREGNSKITRVEGLKSNGDY